MFTEHLLGIHGGGFKTISTVPLTAFLLLATFSGVALAQDSPSTVNSDRALIERLLKRVDELEKNQKQMLEKLATAAHASALPAQAPAAPATQTSSDQIEAEKFLNSGAAAETPDDHVLGPIQFRGFSDLGYGRALLEKPPENGLRGSPNGFTVGDFDRSALVNITLRLATIRTRFIAHAISRRPPGVL